MKAISTMAMVVAAAALVGLGGCAAQQPKVNFQDSMSVSQNVKVKRDDFKKLTSYDGPEIRGKDSDAVLLRGSKFDADPNTVLYQIYAVDFYTGAWRMHDSAYDIKGNRLDSSTLDRKVFNCSTPGCLKGEHVAVTVTREYLENSVAEGIKIKISGRGGEEIFTVPGPYVRGFLDAMK